MTMSEMTNGVATVTEPKVAPPTALSWPEIVVEPVTASEVEVAPAKVAPPLNATCVEVAPLGNGYVNGNVAVVR